MQINLTDENMKQFHKSEDLVVDGEVWEFVEEGTDIFTESGMYQSLYYKQPSTDKVFIIVLFLHREMYEDYGFDEYMQDKIAIEVVQEEVCKMEWVEVSDNE